MATKVRRKMKETILSAQDGKSIFSFTTDIWSSLANDSYISLTAHYVKDFERVNIMLSVSLFNESHTGENIASKMRELLDFWGFERSKIFMILRDNAPNMKAAFRDSGYDSFGCLAHTLQVRKYYFVGYLVSC